MAGSEDENPWFTIIVARNDDGVIIAGIETTEEAPLHVCGQFSMDNVDPVRAAELVKKTAAVYLSLILDRLANAQLMAPEIIPSKTH